MRTPALLVIMDGYGLAPAGPGNAIEQADKPFIDRLFATRPFTTLSASGPDVGLPAGQMGNSEVGHLNMGSGRIVYQELTRINMAVEDGSLRDNEVIRSAMDAAIADGDVVHFMGLLSDGGVHSELSHLKALVDMACDRGAREVCVHAFLDGRDVPPRSGIDYLRDIDAYCLAASKRSGGNVRVATIQGRYWAMDRDRRWDRVEKGYRTLVGCAGNHSADVVSFIEASYADDTSDEFVVPGYIEGAQPGIHDGDAVLFFNFRPDRAREISRAFTDPYFDGFERGEVPSVHYVCLTEYDPDIDAPVAFPKTCPEFVLADYLSSLGLRQLHIAETEKYAHVTFFFNGGVEKPKEGETRVLIDSPKDVATYDLKPQMSAPEVTDALERAIDSDAADVYIVNFANCDMVGHTGSIPAAIRAVEAVDAGLSRIIAAMSRKGGVALVTADHGNAEKMIGDDGITPYTAHTLSRVPFCIALGDAAFTQCDDGRLADVAPTFVDLMGLAIPSAWSGRSLLEKASS